VAGWGPAGGGGSHPRHVSVFMRGCIDCAWCAQPGEAEGVNCEVNFE
jgi:hypothetical protein